MRQLNTTEVQAVSGGFFFKSSTTVASCLSPLAYSLALLGGTFKLLLTGVKSPTSTVCLTSCGCSCGSTGGAGDDDGEIR